MKPFARNPFKDKLGDEDDLLNDADADIDALFAQMEQFKPPADFVNRVMQAVSRLPLPQLEQSDVGHLWGNEGPLVHHEHKQPS
jgi:hypothetical protein